MRRIGKYEKLTPKMQKKVESYRKNATMRTYLYSLLCLVLCCSMFLGTTFAWFTSEVENTGNQINVGTLKVDLQDTDGKSVVDQPAIFPGSIVWAPGDYQTKTLQIVNQGNLAFNYRLTLTGGNANLNEVGRYISVYVAMEPVEGATPNWKYVGKLNHVITGAVPLLSNTYNPEENTDPIAFAIGLQLDAYVDNSISGKSLSDISIKLTATQKIPSTDIFGNKYEEADPQIGMATMVKDQSATLQIATAPSTVKKMTNITIPANAFAEGAKIKAVVNPVNTLFNISSEGGVVASMDVDLFVDGVPFTGNLSSGAFTVSTYIPTGLPEESVKASFVGTGTQPTDVEYDSETGLLIFKTTHFSNYTFSGKGLAYDLETDSVLNDIVEIVEALQKADSKVVVPEVNKVVVSEKIQTAVAENKITAAQQAAVKNAFAVVAIDGANYATLQEAIEKATDKEDVIRLLKDIYLDADHTITIPAGKDITIDLNGKTITGVSDDADKNKDGKFTSADNEVMFDVRGTLTVKNGTITIEHMAENFAWNGCTEVFYVGFNGALNVQNATVENLGGSDMAYAIDVVNATNTTLNISYSTVKSSYIPVRIFNNGSGMNNVSMTNSKIHGGNRAFWVHIYTDKDNGGKGIKNGTLNFAIDYNNVEFVAEKRAQTPICYGFTDAYWYDAKGNFVYIDAETENGLKAAFAEGLNVKLYNDIELTSGLLVPKGKKVELDLNGKAITYKGTEAKATYLIENKGELIINDSAKGGKIELVTAVVDPNYGYATDTILNNGVLTVKGGTIQNNLSGASYAIDNNVGGTTTILGGKILNPVGAAIRVYTWDANTASTLVIKNGEIEGAYAVRLNNLSTSVAGKVNVSIEGGSFCGTGGWAFYSYCHDGTNFNISIAGGEFDGIVAFGGGNKAGQETVSVTGGIFNAELGRYLAEANGGWIDIAKPNAN